jgi:hypothetical protein
MAVNEPPEGVHSVFFRPNMSKHLNAISRAIKVAEKSSGPATNQRAAMAAIQFNYNSLAASLR